MNYVRTCKKEKEERRSNTQLEITRQDRTDAYKDEKEGKERGRRRYHISPSSGASGRWDKMIGGIANVLPCLEYIFNHQRNDKKKENTND